MARWHVMKHKGLVLHRQLAYELACLQRPFNGAFIGEQICRLKLPIENIERASMKYVVKSTMVMWYKG